MIALLTRINRVDQLLVGQYYKICGSAADGLPIPPQVFHLQEKVVFQGQTYLKGHLYWQEAHRRYVRPTLMLPQEVNIPENGWSDIHLEHIEVPQTGLKDRWRYDDIQQHRKLYKPSIKRTYKRLLDEFKKL